MPLCLIGVGFMLLALAGSTIGATETHILGNDEIEALKTCSLAPRGCPFRISDATCVVSSLCSLPESLVDECCCMFGHSSCNSNVQESRSLDDSDNFRRRRHRHHSTKSPVPHRPATTKPTKMPTSKRPTTRRPSRSPTLTYAPSKSPTYFIPATTKPSKAPSAGPPTSVAPTLAPTLHGQPYSCGGCTVYIDKSASSCIRSGISCLDTNQFVECCCAGQYTAACGSGAPSLSPTKR